ncbi:type III-B CRISPR module-associated protein Cmr3, partial [Leptolyngbya sp. PL-A3]
CSVRATMYFFFAMLLKGEKFFIHYRLPAPQNKVDRPLGGEGHRVLLEYAGSSLGDQWKGLQEQSQNNRQALEENAKAGGKAGRSLAYFITPGVFERNRQGVATCRAWP